MKPVSGRSHSCCSMPHRAVRQLTSGRDSKHVPWADINRRERGHVWRPVRPNDQDQHSQGVATVRRTAKAGLDKRSQITMRCENKNGAARCRPGKRIPIVVRTRTSRTRPRGCHGSCAAGLDLMHRIPDTGRSSNRHSSSNLSPPRNSKSQEAGSS